MEWISVQERLPKQYERVLIFNPYSSCCSKFDVGYWSFDAFDSVFWSAGSIFGNSIGTGVTHWMPLPKPPEVEK